MAVTERRRFVDGRSKMEIVELVDSLGAVHLVQQPLVLQAANDVELQMLADWTEAVIENEAREMQARACAAIRFALVRGHQLTPEQQQAARDCGCGK